MIKYFIEREDGSWLTWPGEHRGSAWTRDPNKAWTFGKAPKITQEEKNQGWFIIDTRGGAGSVLDWMASEGLLIKERIHVSKHEFIDCWPGAIRDQNGDIYLDINNDGQYRKLTSITTPVIGTDGNYVYTVKT